jgi:GNAT superfamily N-acetyltransferase
MFNSTVGTPILEVLGQNLENNAPLINVIERNCHEKQKVSGASVRIKDRLSGIYMFSLNDKRDIDALIEDVRDELDTFFINSDVFETEILERFPEAVIYKYILFVMKREDYSECEMDIEDFEIVRLDLDWLDFILEHYNSAEFGNERYLRHRIQNGPGLGLVKDGQKVAFVLQHKDGEAGPLVVDKAYRSIGLGSKLLRCFNQQLFKNNSIIYGFVEPNNMASARMMENSGYKKAQDKVLWVYLKKNGMHYLP